MTVSAVTISRRSRLVMMKSLPDFPSALSSNHDVYRVVQFASRQFCHFAALHLTAAEAGLKGATPACQRCRPVPPAKMWKSQPGFNHGSGGGFPQEKKKPQALGARGFWINRKSWVIPVWTVLLEHAYQTLNRGLFRQA